MEARMRKKGNLYTLWWECKLVRHHGSQYGVSSKKQKIELSCDQVIPLLDIVPKESKSAYNRDICVLMFIMALFTIDKL
jgi:hypothetical protein